MVSAANIAVVTPHCVYKAGCEGGGRGGGVKGDGEKVRV